MMLAAGLAMTVIGAIGGVLRDRAPLAWHAHLPWNGLAFGGGRRMIAGRECQRRAVGKQFQFDIIGGGRRPLFDGKNQSGGRAAQIEVGVAPAVQVRGAA